MAGTHEMYKGGDYGLNAPDFSEYSANATPYPSSQFGFTTDPRTANQIKAVSDKLNTGAKTVEVSGVSLGGQGPLDLIDSIPKQHFNEIHRLKKLAGVDLTFHGPLVEATGFTGRQGWTPQDREQAERQMWSAVERGHDLDPKGNLVITFHSSNGLPEPIEKEMITETDPKTGKPLKDENGNIKKKEIIKNMWFVDERDGQFGQIKPKDSYLEGKKYENEKDIKLYLDKLNQEGWDKSLQTLNYHAYQGTRIIKDAFTAQEDDKEKLTQEQIINYYKEYSQDTKNAEKLLSKLDPNTISMVRSKMQDITHADLYLRDAYRNLKDLYDVAYYAAQKKADKGDKADLIKLEEYKEEIAPKIELFNKNDASKMPELAEEIVRGIHVLTAIKAPNTQKPLREFAIDKASETFANVAFKAYKQYKDNAPIISIENPPVGMGLSRGDDLRELVEAARNKFEKRAMEEKGLSKEEAKKQAEKHIGVTWDVGHINMLRKHGYEGEEDRDKYVVGETKKIAHLVKHVHLSDNFGIEHTELPMGMGNVPTKRMLELVDKYNAQAKKIVETGGAWFRDFKVTPMKETLIAFGSPIYAMQMAPHWNNSSSASGGYFAGYGRTLPEQHFSMYGAGFSTLPVELGGQMTGQSRLSGTPTE